MMETTSKKRKLDDIQTGNNGLVEEGKKESVQQNVVKQPQSREKVMVDKAHYDRLIDAYAQEMKKMQTHVQYITETYKQQM